MNLTHNASPLRPYTTDDIPSLQVAERKPNNIMLIFLLKKLWAMLDDINSVICKDSMTFVINNKPVFDAQKHILIKMQNFAETIPSRRSYQGDRLAADTFSADWNRLAKSANDWISEIDFDSCTENAQDALLGLSANTLLRLVPSRFSTFALKFVCLVAFVWVSLFVGLMIQKYRYVSEHDVPLNSLNGSDGIVAAGSARGYAASQSNLQPKRSKNSETNAQFQQLNSKSEFNYVDAKIRKGVVLFESGKVYYRGHFLLAEGDSAKKFYEKNELRSDNGMYNIPHGRGTNCTLASKKICYEGSYQYGKPHGWGTYYSYKLGFYPGLDGGSDTESFHVGGKKYAGFYGETFHESMRGKLFNWQGKTLYSGEVSNQNLRPTGTNGTYYVYDNQGFSNGTISHVALYSIIASRRIPQYLQRFLPIRFKPTPESMANKKSSIYWFINISDM